MAIFYIMVGISHFIFPSWFVQIVPPALDYPLLIVLISGFFEILLGFFFEYFRARKQRVKLKQAKRDINLLQSKIKKLNLKHSDGDSEILNLIDSD